MFAWIREDLIGFLVLAFTRSNWLSTIDGLVECDDNRLKSRVNRVRATVESQNNNHESSVILLTLFTISAANFRKIPKKVFLAIRLPISEVAFVRQTCFAVTTEETA